MVQDNSGNRRTVRLQVKTKVLLNNSIMSHALDISEGGMYIYTSIPFRKGRIIDVNFSLFDEETPIALRALVVYVHEGIGISVSFTNIGKQDRERIKKFVDVNKDTSHCDNELMAADNRKKILLLDNSIASRNMYKNRLIFMGFAVKEATNAMEAIRVVEHDKPEIIILDLPIEGMDAAKFLQILHSRNDCNSMKVIVLSGKVNPQEVAGVMSLGVRSYLPKMTTTPKKLTEKIEEILAA